MNRIQSALATIAVAVAMAFLSGCAIHGPVAPVDPVVHTQQVASLIHDGTKAATAIGLSAIPNKDEADGIATAAVTTCDREILPLLNGDPKVLANGLKDLLALKAFDNPALAKAKLIVEAALPLVLSYVPQDVISGQTQKIPDDVKAYLVAFFGGVREGCSDYLGGVPVPAATKEFVHKKVDFKGLREKLSK